MLANAVRICEAKFGNMSLREEDAFRTVALHNAPPAYAVNCGGAIRIPSPPDKRPCSPRRYTRQVIHIADILVDEGISALRFRRYR